MDEDFYRRVYRRMHPANPYQPWAHRPELTDLWPVDQEKFKRQIDAIIKELEEK